MQQILDRHDLRRVTLRGLGESPAVALLGARQVGKTTLAREVASGWAGPSLVLDLERARVREALAHTPERTLSGQEGLVVLDEVQRMPELFEADDTQLRRVSLRDNGSDPFLDETVAGSGEVLAVDPVNAVRMILDIVPNPFVGRRIVARFLGRLRDRGFEDSKLGGIARLLVEELRKGLDREPNARAEALFKRAVSSGRIQFRLRLDGRNWRMPFEIDTTEPPDADQLVGQGRDALQKSLSAPVYKSELNREEREVAVYLDGEDTLTWWHRHVARTQYGIQGWRKGKIYPDFIFTVGEPGNRIVVLETKGDYLDNLDTDYNREVLSFLSGNFAWDDYTPAGELELVVEDGQSVQCALVLMSEWRTELPLYLAQPPPCPECRATECCAVDSSERHRFSPTGSSPAPTCSTTARAGPAAC